MDIKEILEKIKKVSDKYEKVHDIKRDDDWYILKLHEEVWELSQVYLSLTWRWRKRDKNNEEMMKNFSDELADVLAQLLLLADKKDIDIEKSLKEKRFKYLD